MWAVALVVLACWLVSLPAVERLLPAALGVHATLHLGLAALAVLAFTVALQRPLTSSQRVATVMLSFAFAVISGTDFVYVWDRMNTIFKFYLEAWFLLAAASAAAVVDCWQGVIRSPLLRRTWQLGVVGLAALALFTAGTGVWAVVHTDRVPTPRPSLDGTALSAATYAARRGGVRVAQRQHRRHPGHRRGVRPVVPGVRPRLDEHRPADGAGLGLRVHQRAQRWPDINKRKDDLKKLYTGDNQQAAAEILKRYHIALVYVGPTERRTYNGANLETFKAWSDLLQPVYSNAGVTIFAVQGQFAGAIAGQHHRGRPAGPRKKK